MSEIAIVRDPIYLQVNDRLRRLLGSPAYSPGSKFLTERQVSERFGISRATANKIICGMVAEGLLEIKKGIGTFVREQRLDFDLQALVGFTEKAMSAGKTPSTKVLTFNVRLASQVEAVVANSLGLSSADRVYEFFRLRSADSVPVILERRFLVARYCEALQRIQLEGSLYRLLKDDFNLDIAGADETIRAVALTPSEASVLSVEPGSPALLVTAVGFLDGKTPLWFERTLFRGDSYEFRHHLGPITNSRPNRNTNSHQLWLELPKL